jgi:hypothetical protein
MLCWSLDLFVACSHMNIVMWFFVNVIAMQRQVLVHWSGKRYISKHNDSGRHDFQIHLALVLLISYASTFSLDWNYIIEEPDYIRQTDFELCDCKNVTSTSTSIRMVILDAFAMLRSRIPLQINISTREVNMAMLMRLYQSLCWNHDMTGGSYCRR